MTTEQLQITANAAAEEILALVGDGLTEPEEVAKIIVANFEHLTIDSRSG